MVEDQQSCCRKKKQLQRCKARKTKQTAKFKSKNQRKQWKGGKRKRKIIIYKQTNQVSSFSSIWLKRYEVSLLIPLFELTVSSWKGESKESGKRKEVKAKTRTVQVRQAALNFDLRLLNRPITAHLSLLAARRSFAMLDTETNIKLIDRTSVPFSMINKAGWSGCLKSEF